MAMLRICVVGSGGVGKSCVTIRYLSNQFTEYYDPTMEETYKTEIMFSGKNYPVEVVDTAGQEEFTSFLDSSLATGDAFIVLYAINSLSSWNDLKNLRSKITNDHDTTSNIPMIIVGNKLDLEDEREVGQDSAEVYAESLNVPYIETSAKTGFNIREAFQLIMQQIQNVKPYLLNKRYHQQQAAIGREMDRREQRDKNSKDCSIL